MTVKDERLGPPPLTFKDKFNFDEVLWIHNLARFHPRIEVYSQSLNVSSVPANSTAEQTFTVTGVASNDMVLSVNKPSHTSGLGIAGFRVSAQNTIAITYENSTGSPIDPAAETYKIAVLRV